MNKRTKIVIWAEQPDGIHTYDGWIGAVENLEDPQNDSLREVLLGASREGWLLVFQYPEGNKRVAYGMNRIVRVVEA